MGYTELIMIISGFIGSLGFALLFNIRGKRFIATGFGGLLATVLYVLFDKLIQTEAITYFLVAVIIAIYAEIMARILKTPSTTFITTSLVPLIPGSSLYYTMTYALESDIENFLNKGIYTLSLASSLALGIIIIAAFTKIVYKLKSR